jgi:hypothetical protein
LVRILRHHLSEFGSAPDGRLFTAQYSRPQPVSSATYPRVWRQGRRIDKARGDDPGADDQGRDDPGRRGVER